MICCISFVRSFENWGESSKGTIFLNWKNVVVLCAARVVVLMAWGGQTPLFLWERNLAYLSQIFCFCSLIPA